MADSTAVARAASPRAAYIHVPFCRHRCGYCNFTVVAGRDDLIDAYLAALALEIGRLETPRPVDTLFLGGGTPTRLPAPALQRLLALVCSWFPLSEGGEFSVEANPGDLDEPRLAVLAAAGVNRISLGAQSFSPAALALLERDHQPSDIARAVELCRRYIHSVSLDLIFAVPGQTVAQWRGDLDRAIDQRPDHLSTYGLTIERGTQFYNRRLHGVLREVDEEAQRTMYLEGIDRMAAAGFEQYEVSNFAQLNHRCRHNAAYWQGEEYYAAGPGAARYVGGTREVNHRSTTVWLRRVLAGKSPVAESETLPPELRAREALVFGLRQLSGIQRRLFVERFGYTVDALGGSALRQYVQRGWIVDTAEGIRLSREGLVISDSLWPELLVPRQRADLPSAEWKSV